jgi:putative ABC transport system ATP-binding protein
MRPCLMPAIAARGLRKTYKSDGAAVHALDGVDVEVAAGEFLAVMGPSGCGKSTLLHMLGALDVPDAGEIELDGKALADLPRKELALIRRRHVGFVFQFFNLVPVLTVEENVALPAALDGGGAPMERVDELLDTFGLSERRHMLPAQLSGGEQQRTAIGRALVNRPALILADEPTGNLDRSSGAEVMSLLRDLNDSGGQTMVIVTHDPAVASHAGRVVFMRDGRLVEDVRVAVRGDPSEVIATLTKLER